VGSLLDEIKGRVAGDKAQQGSYAPHEHETPPPLFEYWEGRLGVDESLEGRFQVWL